MDAKTVTVNREDLFEVLAAATEKHAILGDSINELYAATKENSNKKSNKRVTKKGTNENIN